MAKDPSYNYMVNKAAGKGFYVEVWQDSNVLDYFECPTWQEAHKWAKAEHPSAMTPDEHFRALDAEFNSAEGKAYRRKQGYLNAKKGAE